MTFAHPAASQPLESTDSQTIEAIVQRYFSLFNQGEYQHVANLFAIDGSLYPPFESPLVGREAIAAYLHQEADGMTAEPVSVDARLSEDGTWQVDAVGKVTALVFKVNVAWSFVLTAQHELASVRVDLKASLEDLLKIRPTGPQSIR